LRADRPPMTRSDRVAFFRRHAAGLSILFAVYVLITVIRSIRDDFAVEIWAGMGASGKPFIFAQTELIVMFGVVLATGSAIMIRDNRLAFLTAIGATLTGLALVAFSTFAFQNGSLRPLPFMVLTGLGLYIPYVAFHTTLFERLIAVFREKSNIGFLMYLADATGYLGYIGVMLYRRFGDKTPDHLNLFVGTAFTLSLAAFTLMLVAFFYFRRQMADAPAAPRRAAAAPGFNPPTRSGT
jgi:hypothetical protein